MIMMMMMMMMMTMNNLMMIMTMMMMMMMTMNKMMNKDDRPFRVSTAFGRWGPPRTLTGSVRP